MSLLQAWRLWFSGPEPLTHVLLWGHHLFFWSRVGKAAEFVAALAIVTDIIGPERIRELGDWLHHRTAFDLDRLINPLSVAIIWLGMFLSVVVFGLTLYGAFRSGRVTVFLVLKLAVGSIWGSFLGLSLFAAMIHLCARFLRGSFGLVPWILTRPNASNLIKVASLMLLVVGFHFDVLAS